MEYGVKILNVLSNFGKKAIRLVDKPIYSVKNGLQNDIVELSTKIKPRDIAKKLLVGLDKKTVKQLEKLTKGEFLEESKNIIAKSMNIPLEICPPIIIQQLPNKKMAWAYIFPNNIFIIDKASLKYNKAVIFGGIRHEMQHLRQNIFILRTENLGENAIKTYSQLSSKIQVDALVKISTMSQDKILKLKESGVIDELSLQFIKKFQNASPNDNGALNKISEELFTITHNQWKDMKNTVIEKYGTIKAGSQEATQAEKYFEGVLKTFGQADGEEYISSLHELEANQVQFFALNEYLENLPFIPKLLSYISDLKIRDFYHLKKPILK